MVYEINKIVEREDVITVGGDVTLKELLASDCIHREAASAAEGIRLDLELGTGKEDMSVKQVLFQDISCNCRDQCKIPCLKDGGMRCYGVTGEDQILSVMGNKKVRTPACVQACPVGVQIPQVLEHMRNGEKLEAERLVMKYHPLAETVCPSCGRCSAHCIRSVQNGEEGVWAQKVMHWLGADIGRHPEIFFIPPSGDSGRWIAIKEVTFAGLAAAYYLRRMGNHVIVFQTKEARDILAPWGQGLAEAMKGSLASYIEHLTYMGVVFENNAMDEAGKGSVFERLLSWSAPQGEMTVERMLDEIFLGVKTAEKINLEFGLKSYLEPSKPLGDIQFAGVQAPSAKWETAIEDTKEEHVRYEASRCQNCGCFGISESRTATALFMLEAEIHTDQRVIRIQDYFRDIDPWEQLKPDEEIISLEIPKSGEFVSGCVSEGEITLAYAFLVSSGKLMDLRMTFGGIAPVFIRLMEAEKMLKWRMIKKVSPEKEAAGIMDMLKPGIVVMKDNRKKLDRMERLLVRALEILCL